MLRGWTARTVFVVAVFAFAFVLATTTPLFAGDEGPPGGGNNCGDWTVHWGWCCYNSGPSYGGYLVSRQCDTGTEYDCWWAPNCLTF
jgi:hypothetical protein